MVSAQVLTAAPVEAAPWPVLAMRIGRLIAHRVGGDWPAPGSDCVPRAATVAGDGVACLACR